MSRRIDGAERQGLRLLDGAVERSQPTAAQAACRLGPVGRVRGVMRRAPDPRRDGERGRVPHGLQRRLHGHVAPLLRSRERAWSIYWADSRRVGELDPPVFGTFSGDTGVFQGADIFEGRPILVRYTWSGVTTPTPRWEQAFSEDGGRTWEPNWIMEFARPEEDE